MALKSGRVGIHPSQVDPITGMLLSGPSGTSDYEQLSNLPKINSVTLKGNKSLSDLGVPTTLSALQDVTITLPADGDYFVYDSTTEKWVNSGEAPSPTYLDVTATIYGAVEDTISFTDGAGILHSVTFGTNASSAQETFKIDPSGSSITFTSAVAKDPGNLSNSYTKTITITSGTTNIYVMPSNALYWYGYDSGNIETVNTANGWSWFQNPSFLNPTYNKNDISLSGGSGTLCGVASKSTLTGTVKTIVTGTTLSTNYGAIVNSTSKDVTSGYVGETDFDSSSSKLYSLSASSHYIAVQAGAGKACTVHALWYE